VTTTTKTLKKMRKKIDNCLLRNHEKARDDIPKWFYVWQFYYKEAKKAVILQLQKEDERNHEDEKMTLDNIYIYSIYFSSICHTLKQCISAKQPPITIPIINDNNNPIQIFNY